MKAIIAFCVLLSVIYVSLQATLNVGDCTAAVGLFVHDGCYSVNCTGTIGNSTFAMSECPPAKDCGPGERFVETRKNADEIYPHCCPQTICAPLDTQG